MTFATWFLPLVCIVQRTFQIKSHGNHIICPKNIPRILDVLCQGMQKNNTEDQQATALFFPLFCALSSRIKYQNFLYEIGNFMKNAHTYLTTPIFSLWLITDLTIVKT